MRRFCFFILPLFLVAFTTPEVLRAGSTTIDFESLPDGTVVTNQFPGLTFSNATVLVAGISLNEFENPPFSGSNVVSDDGGPMTISFLAPVLTFGGYFTYNTQLTLTGLDTLSNPIGPAMSAFSNNLDCGAGPPCPGDPGSSPNEFLQIISAEGISLVTIEGDPGGGSFTLDDVTYSAVPEPSTISLILVGGLAVFIGRKRLYLGSPVDNDR